MTRFFSQKLGCTLSVLHVGDLGTFLFAANNEKIFTHTQKKKDLLRYGGGLGVWTLDLAGRPSRGRLSPEVE